MSTEFERIKTGASGRLMRKTRLPLARRKPAEPNKKGIHP
jgi:hypothetical protein